MEKSTFSPLYKVLLERLVSMRKAAGLSQRQLAAKMKREQSFVTRIEQGERRLDVVEFVWYAKACDVPQAAWKVSRELVGLDSAKPSRYRL